MTRAIAFDVVDVLGGLASLTRRSPTLSGSVPVRVAQACVPLLEGNAWGYQLELHRRIELRRRLGGWSVAGIERGDELARLLRATVPVLVADGTLRAGGEWQRRLERGIVDTRGGISVFTGLFVRPRDGVRIRQSATANRRSRSFSVEQVILDDPGGLCPIVLRIEPAPGVDALALEGEIATLGALPARLAIARAGLHDAPEVGRAHLGFYDADYFATKKRGASSRKYRDEIVRRAPKAAGGDAPVRARVVEAGPASVEPARPARFHRPAGAIKAPRDAPPDRLVIRNAIEFTAVFDGMRVAVTPDAGQLARYAREIRAAWERWLGAAMPAHPGSLLYLTKYFTPHPSGEPHFFVKPAALLETSPGTSTVLDGVCGPGYDVMRGVVRSDGFHATPAVFHLWQSGSPIEVARGAPLVEMFPCPRALIDAEISRTTGGVAW